jgi:lipoyl(octanoyl) transferase
MSGDLLWCVTVGTVPYERAREAQKLLEAARHAGEVPDLLLLLEHPPVYTRGRRSQPGELPMGEDWYRMQGIEVCDTDRGGRVTYHGPGQLVAYPIMDLRAYGGDVHDYIRRMERAMIDALAGFGVEAGPIEGLTGVWTKGERPGSGAGPNEARKIGSIGVHVNRGITTHGLAVNVSNDLQPFEWIVPCGIDGCRMTSLTRETGVEQGISEFGAVLRDRFARTYERRPVEIAADKLGERVAGVEALASGGVATVPLPG